VTLGVISVLTVLSVAPVSLHTLVAAMLLCVLVAIATLGAQADAEPRHESMEAAPRTEAAPV